jgi:hypothetical protein
LQVAKETWVNVDLIRSVYRKRDTNQLKVEMGGDSEFTVTGEYEENVLDYIRRTLPGDAP